MLRLLLINCSILCIQIAASAQLDSLKQILTEAKTWEEKLEAHNALTVYYRSRDTSLVMYHLTAMETIANEVKQDYAYLRTARAKGSYFSKISQFSKSRIELNKALFLAEKMKLNDEISSSLSDIGILKYYQNEYDSAHYFLDSAYQLNKQSKELDSSSLFSNLNSLAVVSRKINNYEDAMNYQQRALKIATQLGNEEFIFSALNSMANLYATLGNYEETLQYDRKILAKAEETNNLSYMAKSSRNIGMSYLDNMQDSALFYFKKSLECFNKIGDKVGVIESTISIADFYYHNRLFPLSIQYFQKAIRSAKEIEDDRLLSTALTNVGLVYREQKEFGKAEEHFLKGLEMDKKLGNKEQVVKSYEILIRHYEITKDWESAHFYAQKNKTLSDSINNAKFNETVKSLELEFDSASKDAEINQQNLTIQNQQSEKKFLLSTFLLTSLCLFSGLLFLYYHNRKNKLISVQEQELQHQRISQLQKEKKILSMNRMLEGQESERKRIAQDLHDGLGGLLATIKVKFGIIQKELVELESIDVYQQTSTMIDDACTEVRKIAHNMMPDSLSKLGLIESVRDIAVYTSDISIKVIQLGLHDLSETQEIMLYRVIQEFINNSRKHAKASEVIIQFSTDEKNTIIYLEDNGEGFDAKENSNNRGLGLKSMESRVNFLGGSFDLDSVIGVGTTLQIHLPNS